MATVVTVHGTFAHVEGGGPSTQAGGPADRQWWQPSSEFHGDLAALLQTTPGDGSDKIKVQPFEWSGDNSELARREAGVKLFEELQSLEARKEPYCVVGHSHGGSVMSWALLECAARRKSLDGLRRWITVGTPFVSFTRERLLFSRLGTMQKVIFVASVMLLLMFLVYIAAEMWSGRRFLFGSTFPQVLVITATMMSLPIILSYAVFKYLDTQGLLHYRRRVKRRAKEAYAARWLPLTHTEDEAVQGLAFLPGAKLYFIDKEFARSAITMASVVALPLVYLVLLTSPTLMLGVGDWLKGHVYDHSANPEAEQALRSAREKFHAARGERRDRSERWRQNRESRNGANAPASENAPPKGTEKDRVASEVDLQRRQARRAYRAERAALEARYPELPTIERSYRFRQRFFEEDGKPCAGGRLCGGGHDLRINSGLLLHLVTDELSSSIGGETISRRRASFTSLLIPVVLVPVIFGLMALVLMTVIGAIARVVSDLASRLLNSITNAEVKRAAFGNDTEGEIAVGAVDRPDWLERSPSRLPGGVADLITDYSNAVASTSLGKFRQAIGQLASAEPKHTADSAITTYFTWKELVHASYFDVPQFRKLVAQAISRTDGFAPTPKFQADPDYATTAQWLAEVEGDVGTRQQPGEKPPTDQDAGAVSAVVASTVKAQP